MKEQFDKKLIEKIKISFEDHEEPFNPQEWEKLSHAYFHPAKKKKFVPKGALALCCSIFQ